MALKRIEYVAELMMFRKLSKEFVNSVMNGSRDDEVRAWAR